MPPVHLAKCTSIKSKKNANIRCPNNAVKEGDGAGIWCAKHLKTRIAWQPLASQSSSNHHPLTQIPSHPFTQISKSNLIHSKLKAIQILNRFWARKGRTKLRSLCGPAFFEPLAAENENDIYTYEPVKTIPLKYRFSYLDDRGHCWLFDLRFLMNMMKYGNELKNPFTQSLIPASAVEKLQKRADILRKRGDAIVYVDTEELTPDQIWNQKVLDIFLKLAALNFSANILWFEGLGTRGHEHFYRKLWEMWNLSLGLSEEEKERIVPGHNLGRSPLFKWKPVEVCGRGFDVKWWRKQNLALMRAFLTRTEDKGIQACGALYILTAFATVHPHAADAYPWLLPG